MSRETGRSLSAWAFLRGRGSRTSGQAGKRPSIGSWIILILGMIYFFLPLVATFEFSLRMIKDRYTFEAYRVAFTDTQFYVNFGYSVLWALLTIVISLSLIIPTAYWVHWRLQRARPLV